MRTALSDVTKAAKLISLPAVYLRLKDILDEPDFAMAEIAVVISQDPAITVRLLRMVNSPLYGFATKVETVSRAITLLGTQQVHDLVLATSVAETFKGMASDIMDMRRFWRRSVSCAVAVRKLAGLCPNYDKERLFVAGLLHDIGHLVMYQVIPDLSQQAILAAKMSGEPLYRVERNILGFDYAAINAELLQQWFLPESLQEMLTLHVEPEKAQKYPVETTLIHLGSLLARAGEEDEIFNEGSLIVDPIALEISGLTPEECLSLSEQVKEEVSKTVSLIFPGEKGE